MLIRWATSNEKKKYGFNEDEYKDYDVLIAVNRMTNECLGILGFSRGKKEISKIEVFDKQKEKQIEDNLIKCSNNQIEPKEEMANYMSDVQKVAEVLHKVTGAVKINYEMHCNSGPHLHCHLFPRYLDDDFPSAPIDYRITEPTPYESEEEYRWFINEMRKGLRS